MLRVRGHKIPLCCVRSFKLTDEMTEFYEKYQPILADSMPARPAQQRVASAKGQTAQQ